MAKKKRKREEKPERNPAADNDVRKKTIINSTQSNVRISDFYNGMVIDNEGNIFCVMEVIPSPFFTKKVEEQNRIIRSFFDFLRLAPSNFHIKSITVRADLKDQLSEITKIIDNKEDKECLDMRREYLNHLEKAKNTTVNRRYFISFGYEGTVPKSDEHYKDAAVSWLAEKRLVLQNALNNCGDSIVAQDRTNPNLKTAEIFYTMYNRNSSDAVSFEEHFTSVAQHYMKELGTADPNIYIPPADYLAPQTIEFTDPVYIRTDGLYYTYMFIPGNGFPYEARAGWVTAFNRNSIPGVDIDIYYRKESKANKSFWLTRTIAKQQVNVSETAGAVTDASFQAMDKLRGAYYLKEGLANNDDFYNVGVIITISGASIQEINNKKRILNETAVSMDVRVMNFEFQAEKVYQNVLPFPGIDDELFRKMQRNCLTDGAAMTYPFTSYELICRDGIYIADDVRTGSPVIPDFFDRNLGSNPHVFVCGETGAGKSVAIKLISIRQRIKRQQVFVIVPEKESEFKRICDELGGQFISLGAGSKTRLNIFDISYPSEEAIEFAKNSEGIDLLASSLLSQKIDVLLSFFQILSKEEFGSISKQQILSDAIVKTYGYYGITDDNNSVWADKANRKLKEFPIISDLIQTLKLYHNPETDKMARVLSIFENAGNYSHFNGRTNVNINNDYVAIGLEKNQNDVSLALATYTATEYVWGIVTSNKGKKKSIVMDEWWKMAYNSVAAERTMAIARLARSYNCSLVIATQQMRDVMALENGKYGEAVLNSCATKIILHMQSKDLESMQKMIQLSSAEKEAVIQFSPGEALMLNAISRLQIVFKPSAREKDLTFTDSKTLRRVRERRRKQEERDRQEKIDAGLVIDSDDIVGVEKKEELPVIRISDDDYLDFSSVERANEEARNSIAAKRAESKRIAGKE